MKSKQNKSKGFERKIVVDSGNWRDELTKMARSAANSEQRELNNRQEQQSDSVRSQGEQESEYTNEWYERLG